LFIKAGENENKVLLLPLASSPPPSVLSLRERLFKSINSLPTVYETLSGKAAVKVKATSKKAVAAVVPEGQVRVVPKEATEHRYFFGAMSRPLSLPSNAGMR